MFNQKNIQFPAWPSPIVWINDPYNGAVYQENWPIQAKEVLEQSQDPFSPVQE